MPCRVINKFQSKEERKEKYLRLKAAGFNPQMRRKARDWTEKHVSLLIESSHFKEA